MELLLRSVHSLRIAGLIAALIGVRHLSAQVTAADSDAIAITIARSLLLDLRAPETHHAPVRFASATGSEAWVSRVVAFIRREAPEVLADSGVRVASGFRFADVAISERSVVVHGSFSSCDPGRSGLNAWSLSIEMVMPRQSTGWEPNRPRPLVISDGHCGAKP